MADRGSFRFAAFCIGLFVVVLVSLELFFLVVDEENAAHFSDYPPTKYNDDSINSNVEDTVEDTVDNSERDEPVHFNYGKDQRHHVEDNEYAVNVGEKLSLDKDIPVMIWWTPFTWLNATRKCSLGECFTTNDRSMQHDKRTQVFFFYGTDFSADDLPLPRRANHEWALLHEESPKNNPILFHENTIVLFNHTATFRRFSDFPLVTQCLESIDVLEKKPLYTLEEKASDKNKASVVYVQSGCNPPSDRDVYVQELMKYIKIDSLGQCLNNKELPQEYKDSLTYLSKGFFNIVGKYKFSLAFENAICDDYITEKLWRPLELGSVPIYHGSPSVLDWMPDNHSVIVVDNFPNPEALAEYIKKLDADDSLYLKYLEFKQEGGVKNTRLLKNMKERKWSMVDGGNSFVTGFECFVCDRIHENLNKQKSGLSTKKHVANQKHFGCPRPVQFKYPPVKGTKQYERDTWQTEYDGHMAIAEDLNKAVLSGEKDFKFDGAKNGNLSSGWF